MPSEGPPQPRWSAGLDSASARRVRNLVAQELRARGITELRFLDDGVEWIDPTGRTSMTPLASVARECSRSDPASWSSMVKVSVDHLFRATAGEHPTLRGSDPEPEILAPPRRWSTDLESTAPPGGVLSPFAPGRRGTQAEDPDDTSSDSGTPPDTLQAPDPVILPPPPVASGEWLEAAGGRSAAEMGSEELTPRWRRLSFGLLVAALVATVGLEIRGLVVGPEAPDLRATVRNEVLLEATPAGQVVVVAEGDGRLLGRAPLRMLVAEGVEVAVFLAAPDRTPQRVVLPSHGQLRVRLEPRLPTAKKCTVEFPGSESGPFQKVLGEGTSDLGELEVTGSTLIRVVPEGYGAWIVPCPPEGGRIEVDLRRRYPPLADVRVDSPIGAILHLDDQPMGSIPVRWTQARSFSRLRVRTVNGDFVARWVATPAAIAISFPIDNKEAPALTVPGTAVEDPKPYYLRRKTAPDRADDQILDIDE